MSKTDRERTFFDKLLIYDYLKLNGGFFVGLMGGLDVTEGI